MCSRSAERAQKVAETVGAGFTTDLDAVLADTEIDAVDICLPTPVHREVAERAFAAGKHVLLEKPIALTVEDGEAILAAAEQSGRTLMVGLVLRFFAEYAEIERRVASGEIGAVREVSAYRLSFPADWADWIGDPVQTGGTPSISWFTTSTSSTCPRGAAASSHGPHRPERVTSSRSSSTSAGPG